MIRANSWFAFSVPRFAQPDYYITSFSVCQGVFQKFFKFFQKLFSTAFQPERKCLSIIPHPLVFVKRFFKSFSTFFKVFFARRRSRSSLLSSDSHIIALSFPFVNRFLQSFLSLELRAGLHKQRASRLCNLPNKCQFLSQTGECSGSVTLIFHAFSPSMRQSAF